MAYNPYVDTVKVEKLSAVSWELLQREITLPNLITTRNGDEFVGSLGDAVRIKVPARTKAKSRALRPATEQDRVLQMSSLTENSFLINIDEDIYNAVPIEDEVLKLDIEDIMTQVLAPQVRSVAIGYENKIAAEIENADYVFEVEFDPAHPYESLVEANRLLGSAFVPVEGRTLLVGANVEAMLLVSPQFVHASSAGDMIAASRLQTATLGQIAGYRVVKSYAIDPDSAFLFHKSAFAASTLSPVVPKGASFGKSIGSPAGVALTWIHDYDFLVSRDRSLVHVYAGTNTFKDMPDENADSDVVAEGGLLRAVKLTLGNGGS